MLFPAFTDFAGLWVPICLSGKVRPAQPKAMVLAGVHIVLFRDEAGEPRALIDRCPHRGVALSLGTVDKGVITCPFHGWQFSSIGQCIHVPWNPDAKRDRLSATSVPVRELGGLIWVFSGSEPKQEPVVPEALLRPDIRVTSGSYLWQVHWTRVMENMLDAPHLPFVHASTIGKRLRSRTAEKMEMLWQPTETGGDIITMRAGEPPKNNLRYHFPNVMEMMIDSPKRFLRLLAVCTPGLPGQTWLTIYTMRNFAKARAFDPVFARMNARIAAEDKAIIESSMPAEVPLPADELSVATDAPTLGFRKIWFTRIRGSHLQERV